MSDVCIRETNVEFLLYGLFVSRVCLFFFVLAVNARSLCMYIRVSIACLIPSRFILHIHGCICIYVYVYVWLALIDKLREKLTEIERNRTESNEIYCGSMRRPAYRREVSGSWPLTRTKCIRFVIPSCAWSPSYSIIQRGSLFILIPIDCSSGDIERCQLSIVAACVHAYTNASRLGETRGKAVFAGRSVRFIGELVLQGTYANILIHFFV